MGFAVGVGVHNWLGQPGRSKFDGVARTVIQHIRSELLLELKVHELLRVWLAREMGFLIELDGLSRN